MEPLVIDWDGSHVPGELTQLPPGRYALEPIDVGLSPEQDDGVRVALEALDAGRGFRSLTSSSPCAMNQSVDESRPVAAGQAGDDLREIHEFIRDDSPDVVDTGVARIIEAIRHC